MFNRKRDEIKRLEFCTTMLLNKINEYGVAEKRTQQQVKDLVKGLPATTCSFTIVALDDGSFEWSTRRESWTKRYVSHESVTHPSVGRLTSVHVGGTKHRVPSPISWSVQRQSDTMDIFLHDPDMPSGTAKTARSAERKARKALVPYQLTIPASTTVKTEYL
jgi:hypothetical protein